MKHWTYETLDGASLHRKPKNGWGTWKWILVIIFLAFFIYRSTRPVLRLRLDPPAQFLNVSSKWNEQQRQAEERMAREYWQVAIQSIQSLYSPAKPLPASPPPEFKISREKDVLQEEESRTLYWQQLRKVWDSPQTWVESAEWHTDWLSDMLSSAGRSIERWLDGFLGAFKFWPDRIG